MTRLSAPLARQFEDPSDEQALAASWHKIRDRREVGVRRPWLLWGAFAATAAAGLAVFVLGREPGPLTAANGEALGVALAPAAVVKQIELSDHSLVRLSSGTQVVLGESSSTKLHLILRSGEMDLDVRSKGRPTWLVDCGWVKVEITGTRLVLRRDEAEVEIAVMEGTVRVSGEGLVPPVQYLGAGARIIVPAALVLPVDPAAPPAEPSPKKSVPRRRTEAPVKERAGEAVKATELDEEGADELLAKADAARRAGRPKEAVAILQAAEARALGTKAAVIAFTLGRVELDDLADAEAAALAFERALAGPLPSSLIESALARAVEARGRAGHVERARAHADAYLGRFPNGKYLEAVSRWSKP